MERFSIFCEVQPAVFSGSLFQTPTYEKRHVQKDHCHNSMKGYEIIQIKNEMKNAVLHGLHQWMPVVLQFHMMALHKSSEPQSVKDSDVAAGWWLPKSDVNQVCVLVLSCGCVCVGE